VPGQNSGSLPAAGPRGRRRGGREGAAGWSAAWTASATSCAVSASTAMVRRTGAGQAGDDKLVGFGHLRNRLLPGLSGLAHRPPSRKRWTSSARIVTVIRQSGLTSEALQYTRRL
jgi:hypothetical protein